MEAPRVRVVGDAPPLTTVFQGPDNGVLPFGPPTIDEED
jgi:hypothetical protein